MYICPHHNHYAHTHNPCVHTTWCLISLFVYYILLILSDQLSNPFVFILESTPSSSSPPGLFPTYWNLQYIIPLHCLSHFPLFLSGAHNPPTSFRYNGLLLYLLLICLGTPLFLSNIYFQENPIPG